MTLPSTTTPGGGNIQSYLMALTLEEPGGAFVMPDLTGADQFPNDHDAPQSSHALDPAAPPTGGGGWYRAPVRVTLTGSDETGGSGVEQILYRVDGGAAQAYGTPFEFSTEGEHTLEYRAIDRAGNAEGFKPVTIKLDTKAPVSSALISPDSPLGEEGWHDGAVKVTLTAADGQGSGAGMTRYRIDGAAEWSIYGGPVTVDEGGIHLVEYRSTDVAGNEEAIIRELRVRVDKTAPQTSVRLNGGAPAAEYIGAVRVGFARSDGAEGSGVVETEYRLGDGPWTPYTEAFDLAGNGGHRIDFRSRDLAGNVENFRSVMFVIRPTVAASPGSDSTLAPKPGRFAALEPLATRQATLARLRRGLPVHISCQGVQRGTLSLTVSRTTMRRLKLRTRTLLARAVRCGAEGRATVTIKPGTRVRRALSRSRASVPVTLTLRFGAVRDTQTVTFRGQS